MQNEPEHVQPGAPPADKTHKGAQLTWYLQLFTLVVIGMIVGVNSLQSKTNAYLVNRSVSISTSVPGAVASHTFRYDILSSPSVGSIVFEYCTNSPLPSVACIPPTGLNTSGAVLSLQQGQTGFSVHPDTTLTQNRIILTRPAAIAAPGTSQYVFGNVTNPSGASIGTSYVRISLHSSTDGSGAPLEDGAVTFSVQGTLSVSVYVPPFLILCTGVSVAVDCTNTNGVTIDMGELSKTGANSATTQFAVATNSINGYVASIQGNTMTAGNRTIPPLVAPTNSQPGVSQFGINLRANTNPSVGNDVAGSGTAVVQAGYANPNTFKFQSGDIIATSNLPTEWNRFTISYLVNVADGQPAGRYASTLTVIATTTF